MAAHLTPEQLARAIALQRRGWTQTRIAKDLGVDQSTVSRSLSRHNRRSLKRLEKRAAEIKAKQVDQLEWMVEEALDEWTRSKLDSESVKTTEEGPKIPEDTAGPIVVETKTETTVKGQTGNPALLREARGALADVRKILGLDAPPTKQDEAFDLSQLTAEAEAEADTFIPDERPRPDQEPTGKVPQ